jgi:hypothetical protein
MSISRLSRYYDGPIAQLPAKTEAGIYNIAVFRKFPESQTARYVDHSWEEGDSLANLAYNSGILYTSEYWWKIMDLNPEITDPFSIEPGTIIRIPHV